MKTIPEILEEYGFENKANPPVEFDFHRNNINIYTWGNNWVVMEFEAEGSVSLPNLTPENLPPLLEILGIEKP